MKADRKNPARLFEIDRLNYPRPHMAREQWMPLTDQPWSFAFDDNNQGLKRGWQHRDDLGQRINMPFPYQSEASSIADKGRHDIVWYARRFSVPETWSKDGWVDHDLILHFGAVKTICTVFINGQEAKNHVGGYVPFSLNATPFLNRDGSDNLISLRIEHRLDPDIPLGKDSLTNQPFSIWYTPATGVWQPIWMEPCPNTEIEDVRLIPSARRRAVDVYIAIGHADGVGNVTVEAFDHKGTMVASAEKPPRASGAQLWLNFPDDVRLWSPKSPYLYDVRVTLWSDEGTVLDVVQCYTGLRDITLKNGCYHINGEPIFLFGPLDQGYFPGTLIAAPSGEALKRDVELILSYGFNMDRKHAKIEDPRWYYWAAKLGLMVWQDMPCARTSTPESERWLSEEYRSVCTYHASSVAIITYTLDNETFSSPGLQHGDKKQRAFLEEQARVMRQMDLTRPVIPQDGWANYGGHILTVHDYSASGEEMKERYRDIETGGPFVRNAGTSSESLMAPGETYSGQPIVLTEFGGLLWNRPEESGIGYAHVGAKEEYLQKYEDLVQAIADMGFWAGAIYTQAFNVQQEKNGLMDENRQPLVTPDEIRAIHERVFTPAVLKRNVGIAKQVTSAAAKALRKSAQRS